MILADKIVEQRKKNGWSQEELAEKMDVSRQSISKWESAQSAPDMNRILKMSEIFGVSTDYLLKDNLETLPGELLPEKDVGSARPVSMEEASAFLAHKDKASGRVSIGVMMCILSPVLLIILGSLRDGALIPLSETAVAGIGVIVLLMLVGGAVALFITTGLQGSRFAYLEKEEIDTQYGVDGMVRDRQEKYRHTYSAQLVTGIVLCVVSAIPIFITLLIFGEDAVAMPISIAVLLVIVAFGVFLIVRTSMVWGGYQILLQEGEYTVEQKLDNQKNAPIAEIYWGLTVAFYLAISFLTNAWEKTWIVWPVAGVAYGAVMAVARVLRKR